MSSLSDPPYMHRKLTPGRYPMNKLETRWVGKLVQYCENVANSLLVYSYFSRHKYQIYGKLRKRSGVIKLFFSMILKKKQDQGNQGRSPIWTYLDPFGPIWTHLD